MNCKQEGDERRQGGEPTWCKSSFTHLPLEMQSITKPFSVHLNPGARLRLTERQEETSVDVQVVKLACDGMAAVTEIS